MINNVIGADEVLSASGKKVHKGEISKDSVPEVRYEEILWGEKIGGGQFGSVFKGKCRGLTVAVKRLLKQTLDEKLMEEFRKEVDIMTQMRHPNIVLFLGACTEPGKMCILCELMTDSVYNVVRKNKDITTLQRLSMALDTASGMAWLHGATPQILHRDLKSQNLLVDDKWNIKICDFGLSQVKPNHECIRDGKSIPGTPLWMAPEVLLGKDVDEKSDIYSFGIVLWEIMTGDDPFPHHDDFATFKHAITKLNERPEIPTTIHPKIAEMMQICWHADKTRRPSFQDLLILLDNVIIDVHINDPAANFFWKKNYLGVDHVPWTQFVNDFAKLLKLPPPLPKDIGFLCLRKILAEPNVDPKSTDPDMMRFEKFAHVINWFGPLVLDHKGYTILDKVQSYMRMEWFHGDVNKENAENLLAGQPKGTFLLRTSYTDPHSPFTISKVAKNGKISHQRIHKRPNGTFEITLKYSEDKSKVVESKDDSLPSFIKMLHSELYLKTSCPGSLYKSLFVAAPSEGYGMVDN